MTEWNASEYRRQSALQKWLADESLAGVSLAGGERVLDVGCGDGRITAEIAARLPRGSVLGIDPSTRMIGLARTQDPGPGAANLAFEVGDATRLSYRGEFDLVVSFNALHWVSQQAAALAGIRQALRSAGRALLQFVPEGARRSLEDVLEDTRRAPEWSRWFSHFRTPYVHYTPDEYRGLAAQAGLAVGSLEVQPKAWDFGSRQGFVDFARVTFVEWTQHLPDERRDAFIADVLDRYEQDGDAGVFRFYQMRVELAPA